MIDSTDTFSLNEIPLNLSEELLDFALSSCSNRDVPDTAYPSFDSNSILQLDQLSFAFDDFENQLRSDFASNSKFTDLGGLLSSIVVEAKENMDEINMDFSTESTRQHSYQLKKSQTRLADSDEDFLEEDLDIENEHLSKPTSKRRRGREKKLLSKTFKGSSTVKMSGEASKTMGIANDAFVKRNYEIAIENFLEVIRLSPKSHEPYHSLGLIYEEMDLIQKAICYYFLSAQLNPNDAELWKRLAVLCQQTGKIDLALYMMSRALKQVAEVEYSQERIQLSSSCGYRKQMIKYMEFHALNFPQDHENIKQLSNLYLYEFKTPDKALAIIQKMFDFHEQDMSQFTFTHLNYLCELAYLLKRYDIIEKYIQKYGFKICQLNYPAIDAVSSPIEVLSLTMQKMPFELQAKFIIGKAFMGKSDFAIWMQNLTQKCPLLTNVDLYLQIAQAFLDTENFHNAISIYEEYLQHSQTLSVLLLGKLIDCYAGLGNVETAISYSEKILSLDPANDETKLKLIRFYKQVGDTEKSTAIIMSMQSSNADVDDGSEQEFASDEACGNAIIEFYTPERCKEIQLEFQKFNFHFHDLSNSMQINLIEASARILVSDLLSNGFLLRSSQSSRKKFSTRKGGDFFNFNDIMTEYENIFADDVVSKSIATNSSMQAVLADPQNRKMSALHGLAIDDWFSFVSNYAVFLSTTQQKYREACVVLHQAGLLNIFHFETKKKYFLKFLQLGIALRQHSDINSAPSEYPLEVCNWFFLYFPLHPKSLPLLYATGSYLENQELFIRYISSQKAHKRFKRLHKLNNSLTNSILYANISSLNMTHNYAVCTLQNSLKKYAQSEYLQKLLAFALLNRSISRRCPNKHFYILQAFEILNSICEKQPMQENFYNLARAFHMLGMFTLAEYNYKLALKQQSMDLEYQIGYNLHLIYVKSGSVSLAARILMKYCTI